jgi:type IV pilus assembly protein PilV
MNNKSTIKFRRIQAGTSLIEVLVAIIIFSFGILGLAVMQSSSLVQAGDIRQSAVAAWKAQDLAARIKATRTAENPLGNSALYVAQINNNGDSIGEDSANNLFACPAEPGVVCSQRNNAGAIANAQQCTAAELAAYDVWEVFCNESTGVSAAVGTDGAVGLQNMEVALLAVSNTQTDPGDVPLTTTEFIIALEWVSGLADGLADVNNTITTNLCGINRDVDPKLEVYCLRFK